VSDTVYVVLGVEPGMTRKTEPLADFPTKDEALSYAHRMADIARQKILDGGKSKFISFRIVTVTEDKP
jgi:hypothetical protein